MDYTNSIVLRRKRYKDAKRSQMQSRQDRLKVHADSLNPTEFLPNDKEAVMGISNNFSSPVLASSLSANSELFSNDEPIHIQSLRLKGRNQRLSQKDKDQLQRYYYMQDSQDKKDERFVLGETYKIGRKFFGL